MVRYARPVRRLASLTLTLLFSATVVRAQSVSLEAASIQQLAASMDAGTITSERLVALSLARMDAYDDKGPRINAVLARNPRALEQARALDLERKTKGKRSLLHGIPVVLKDNYDTRDLPTTGGSVLLEGSLPPDDAFLVKKLRDAGAVIIAKVNLSEFASGGAFSSLGGQTLNPHDLLRSPSGSSGGTGAAIAAVFATLGLGTDTGGSIRGPSTVNGIVGLKPTHGLLSRDGIIPLALSFDTGGPMARHVSDIAVVLGLLTGIDPADAATKKSDGRFDSDYTKYLDINALKGARIGIARDFLGQDAEVDWVVEASLTAMRAAGATIVDVRLPKWLLDAKGEFYTAVRYPEFPVQLQQYLATLGPSYPKTLSELSERADRLVSLRPDGSGPNATRWSLFKRELASGTITDARYTSVHEYALPLVTALLEGTFTANALDAIVYPTASRRPDLINAPLDLPGGGSASGMNLANLTGFPDLIVPAGFTTDRLPVGISFIGRAFTEGKLLGLGYAFEQITKARRLPVHTPQLPAESIPLAKASSGKSAKAPRKAVFILLDGIPADVVERVATPALDDIAAAGGYARAHVGGALGKATETPTISAPGYMSLLTSTWANKHNVRGNSNQSPNYAFWNIFRIVETADSTKQTAIFSTWLDNRTVLLGAGRPEAGNYRLDHASDGYERDTVAYPHDPASRYIMAIDERVATDAATYIAAKGPDLSWVYLQHTDDAAHAFGDSKESDAAVQQADQRVQRIWNAVKQRQALGEDWMIVVTTDHGRDPRTGKGHGGQSERERTTWITTNQAALSTRFTSGGASIVDIAPSLLQFLRVSPPASVAKEMEGVSFMRLP